jgi:hypothetical protein
MLVLDLATMTEVYDKETLRLITEYASKFLRPNQMFLHTARRLQHDIGATEYIKYHEVIEPVATTITVSAYYVGFKLFEEKNSEPRSLVHGMPDNQGKRSRIYPLNIWLRSEEGTPGFNCFTHPQALLDYLPRFKVRASSLYACRVMLKNPVPSTSPNYRMFKEMCISSYDWNNAIVPADVDYYEEYTERLIRWEMEAEARFV